MLISKFNNENVEVDIIDFEKKNNIVLPEKYRTFLLKYNGGDTPNTHFNINKISSDIKGFMGFNTPNEFLDFQHYINLGVIKNYLNDKMLPIAINDFGDIITVSLYTDEKSKVYFLYHDKPKKYIELSEDFESFVGKCISEKIGHIRTIDERKQCLIDNGKGDKITEVKIKFWQAEIDKYASINQEELIL